MNTLLDDNLDEMQKTLLSLESLTSFCSSLMSSNRLTLDLALESEVVMGAPAIMESFFTAGRTGNKHTLAIESVVGKIKETLKKFIAMIMAAIAKIIAWLEDKSAQARTRFVNPLFEELLNKCNWSLRDEIKDGENAIHITPGHSASNSTKSELEGHEKQWRGKFNGLHIDLITGNKAVTSITAACAAIRAVQFEETIDRATLALFDWHGKATTATEQLIKKTAQSSSVWMHTQLHKDADHDDLKKMVEDSLPSAVVKFQDSIERVQKASQETDQLIHTLRTKEAGLTKSVVESMRDSKSIASIYKSMGTHDLFQNKKIMQDAVETLKDRLADLTHVSMIESDPTDKEAGHALRLQQSVNTIVMSELERLIQGCSTYGKVVIAVSACIHDLIVAELMMVTYYRERLRIGSEQEGVDKSEVNNIIEEWSVREKDLRTLLSWHA